MDVLLPADVLERLMKVATTEVGSKPFTVLFYQDIQWKINCIKLHFFRVEEIMFDLADGMRRVFSFVMRNQLVMKDSNKKFFPLEDCI